MTIKLDVASRLKNHGVSNHIICCSLDVSRRTLYRWQQNNWEDLTRRGRPIKLSTVHDSFIEKLVKATPAIAQLEIAQQLATKYGVEVSQQTIQRALSRLNITRKVMTKTPAKGDPCLQTRFLKSLLPHVHYVAIDEAAIIIPSSSKYGYAPRGQRAEMKVASLPRQRKSLIVALSSQHSLPFYWLQDDNIRSDIVHDFLKHVPWNKANLILDNASYHRKVMHHWKGKVLYLPPYSPQLNPVELFFQTFKAKLRRKFTASWDSVDEILREAVSTCQSPNLFRHCLFQ